LTALDLGRSVTFEVEDQAALEERPSRDRALGVG
jgi:hypothetical protein